MALSVVSEPVDIVLARNPVILHLLAEQSGGDLYAAVGESSSMSILLADRFAAGETITVDYEEPDGTTESLTFTAAGAYDPAADEIPDDTWAGSSAAYWTEVAAIINAHPRIAPFFTCEAVTVMGSLTIKILARSVESGWDVSLSNDAGFSVADDPGSADATPDNYRVLVEVFFEKTYRAGDYERVAQLEGQPAAENGWLYFDISNVLAAQCRANRAEPLVPVFGAAVPAVADNLRRYYIRYTEEYGSPAVVQDWAYTTVKYAIDGGVSQAIFAESGFSGYLADKAITDAFLTWMPDGRHLGPEQPEYLPWYNYTGATQQVVLQVVTYDVDTGSADTPIYAYGSDLIDVRDMETLLIPVSLDVLQAALSSTFATDKYKIVVRVVDATSDWETDDPEFFSEARTYFIDRQYYEASRYVQYLNSFGVPECWRCTGEWTKRLNVIRQTATKSLMPGYNELASDSAQYARTFDNILVYRTGYLRKAEAEVLQELLLAGELYDVGADGYIPLRITDNRFDVTSTRETLHSYQFTAQPRLNMINFSKKKITASGDAWQEVGSDFWFDALLVAWEE